MSAEIAKSNDKRKKKKQEKHQQIIPAWNTLLLLLALWNKQKSHGTRKDRPDTHNFDALTLKLSSLQICEHQTEDSKS